MRRITLFALCSSLLYLSGCTEDTPKKSDGKKQEEAPPEPVSGDRAFSQMYPAARAWARDAEPLSLRSINLPGVPKQPGKGAAWEGSFVSVNMSKAKSWTYSVIEAEGNLHKGLFAGPEQSWSGPRGAQKPFAVQGLKKDSTTAYKVALEKGKNINEYLKKFPDRNVFFVLEQTNRYPQLTWRVVWGDSVSTSDYSVFVDASTGEYLATIR